MIELTFTAFFYHNIYKLLFYLFEFAIQGIETNVKEYFVDDIKR